MSNLEIVLTTVSTGMFFAIILLANKIDILKKTLTLGTARRTPLEGGRPSAGKTGTQDENTNAWFVGSTKQITTAVLVGDPKG